MGVVESRTGSTRWDAEGLGDLSRRVPEVVMHGEDGSLLGRQPLEPAFELVPIGHAEQFVARSRSVDREHAKDCCPVTLARRLGDADVDEQTLEPGVEPVRIAEAPQVAPGDHQRILKGILGPVDVSQDPMGDREEAVHPGPDEVDVRLPVTVPCRFDEVAIHQVLPPEHPMAGAVRNYW
jgi:hypothetical protein